MPFPLLHGTPTTVASYPIPRERTVLDNCGRATEGPRRRARAWAVSRSGRITGGPMGHAQGRECTEHASQAPHEQEESKPAAYERLQWLVPHKRSRATSRRSSSGLYQPGATSRRLSPVGTSSPAASRRHHCMKGSPTVEVYAGPTFAWPELASYCSPPPCRPWTPTTLCFKCFRCFIIMLHVFHLDVAKVYLRCCI